MSTPLTFDNSFIAKFSLLSVSGAGIFGTGIIWLSTRKTPPSLVGGAIAATAMSVFFFVMAKSDLYKSADNMQTCVTIFFSLPIVFSLLAFALGFPVALNLSPALIISNLAAMALALHLQKFLK